jgi:transcriptional regulator with XRE-family HTH domain
MAKSKQEPPTSEEVSLGEALRQIREMNSFTLRAVERMTGVSNAYLSQLERGKIDKPSPGFLFKLAEAYGVPYDQLMEKAGYISRDTVDTARRPNLLTTALASLNLTPEEEREVVNYATYLLSKRHGRGDETPNRHARAVRVKRDREK